MMIKPVNGFSSFFYWNVGFEITRHSTNMNSFPENSPSLKIFVTRTVVIPNVLTFNCYKVEDINLLSNFSRSYSQVLSSSYCVAKWNTTPWNLRICFDSSWWSLSRHPMIIRCCTLTSSSESSSPGSLMTSFVFLHHRRQVASYHLIITMVSCQEFFIFWSSYLFNGHLVPNALTFLRFLRFLLLHLRSSSVRSVDYAIRELTIIWVGRLPSIFKSIINEPLWLLHDSIYSWILMNGWNQTSILPSEYASLTIDSFC